MTLRYTLEKISPNGTKDVISQDFSQDEIVIGRGAECDLRLESNYISLRQAKFGLREGRAFIEDQGSLSAIQVNRRVEKFRLLAAGDVVKLADVSLTVTHEDGVWGLKEVREAAVQVDNETIVAEQLKQLNIATHLPSFFALSFFLFILVAGFFLVWPLLDKAQTSWEAGPISNHHRMIASDCQACHNQPFVQVQDKQCLACHTMSDHAPFLKDHHGVEGRCASCHMEHNGENGMLIRDSKLCLDCHSDIRKLSEKLTSPNVPSFSEHPSFSVEVQSAEPGGESRKVKLDDKENLKDNSNIKLNHEVHLAPIRSKHETVQLECRDCHNASKDLTSIEPINFEKHCNSCHGLEFDDRLPGVEVPHGDPNNVYNFLYAEYAKLLLGSDDSTSKAVDFAQRFKPGAALPSVAAQPSVKDDFKQAFVEKESRNSERVLFTRTACYLCHRVLEVEEKSKDAEKSHFEIIKPTIPTDWMPDARFDHGAHEEVQCLECHEGVRESTKTNQVLLPNIKKCQDCHSEEAKHGLVQSDCVMCHSYHDQQLVSEDKKRSINEILRTISR